MIKTLIIFKIKLCTPTEETNQIEIKFISTITKEEDAINLNLTINHTVVEVFQLRRKTNNIHGIKQIHIQEALTDPIQEVNIDPVQEINTDLTHETFDINHHQRVENNQKIQLNRVSHL